MRPARSLQGDRLVLQYGRSVAVHGVSVRLRPGLVTAFVGPNGSGKSTLLRSLARLHDVAEGQVLLGDEDAPGTPVSLLTRRDFAREVTLFAQTHAAPEGLSVAEIVALGRHPYRRRLGGLSDDDRRAIDHAMQVTGLQGKAGRAAAELSGGEMQRVWLAACLAQSTGVVLLDEPTNHLDLRYQVETLDLMRELAEAHDVAVGVVLHDLEQAASVADELLLLDHGRVHAEGEPDEVLTAEHIQAVYGIPVDVGVDPGSGALHIDPVSRRRRRRASIPREETRKDHE
ncbi:ABC transporter ATP-binding protein [Pseudoclavibacter sp. CFCC 13611]|uniref:ABC transporter ATP-binding protein n=1 Tax=Pseudoclavibacter sp. CFCC 13611 TaxID=2615178 RepID=UPI0013012F18|nr:ABC transporter ATP-binding protein [Pseudoclavibacter sp. CFCC 13611]KAB1662819.1 ABC transporter ATP-binding protein [Pseudoclavibacter sp. CFCC 13611]